MKKYFIIYLMVMFYFFLPHTVMAEDGKNGDQITVQNIFIAGFVRDEYGKGVPEVDIIIEHNNRKIMSLRSMQDGWFESVRGVPVAKSGLDIRMILIKPGYKFVHKTENLSGYNHIFDLKLPALPGHLPPGDAEEQPSFPLYGFIEKPQINGKKSGVGIAGAKVTLSKSIKKEQATQDSENVKDIAISRDSGFFTLHYKSELRRSKDDFKYSIEHPKYNPHTHAVQLIPQHSPINVSDLTERYFDIAWFFRLGIFAPTDGEVGGYSPFSSHVNILRLFELAYNKDLVPTSKQPEWSVYISNYSAVETDVGALMFGASWKPLGIGQSKKIALDFALGVSDIEINKESRHITKFPHVQFGVSFHRDNPYESFAAPHYRIGGTAYEDNIGWNYLLEFTFLGI